MRCQASQPTSPSERQTDRLGALLLDNRCREPHHCAFLVFAIVGVWLSECNLPRALVLKVQTLEARAREAGVQRYVLNADCARCKCGRARIFFYHRLACRACSWQHTSSVYKLAPWARVFVCLQSAEGEGSCRVRSLSHVAFLSVFRLLSGSSVRLIIIKQTPQTPFRLRKKRKEAVELECWAKD